MIILHPFFRSTRRKAIGSETLKYLYLLFAPQALDFDTVVFNTEAHPLRRTWRGRGNGQT